MKANAPEKIYLDPTLDALTEALSVKTGADVEYTRTDAFNEKACRAIEKLLSGYIIRNFNFGDSYDIDRLIEDFKKAMEE